MNLKLIFSAMINYVTKPIPPSQPQTQRGERPWGSWAQYANNEDSTVTMMTVEPGARLSLQSHTGRAELWIIIDDGAVVEIDDATYRPKPGDELWIPAGAKHRLSSGGPRVRVLEVAFGNWQQQDITRYADDYNRPEHGE